MHRSRAPSIAPGTFFVAQSWAGCITNMPGFILRQAQAVAILREHHRRGTARPMPPDTLNNAIRSLGFAKEAHCAHGTRATAKTLLGARSGRKTADRCSTRISSNCKWIT
jgi:hypothetical protein